MSTKDQTLSSALHGEALLAARRPELQPLIEHLREAAQGRHDIRTECAGVIAGAWFGGIGRRGEELIAAGLLMFAGPIDLDELDKWLRVGWERRRGGVSAVPGQGGLEATLARSRIEPRPYQMGAHDPRSGRAPGIDPVKTGALAHDC